MQDTRHGGDVRSVTVAPGVEPDRLDRVLARALDGLSRSRLQSLVREGCVRCDGAVMRDPARRIGPGSRLDVAVPAALPAEPAPETIALSIVHEDDDLVVLDKPARLVVHPGAGHESGTLVNALVAHCGESLSGIGGVRRPGIVHRLDKDTSGLLVVAKNDRAHRGLSELFADHGRSGGLERAYLALVWGVPAPTSGTIRANLARSRHNREKIAVVREGEGRHAVTHYRVEAVPDPAGTVSLLRCRLETGRTHQIRVHLSARGHPLLGDDVYGSAFRTKAAKLNPDTRAALDRLGRQALHAATLGFLHPRTGVPLRFESPLPPDMAVLLAALDAGG